MAPKVELKWWAEFDKKANFKDTALVTALKAYEVAEDQLNYTKMLEELTKVAARVKLCAGKDGIEKPTKELLKKYQEAIAKKLEEIRHLQSAAKTKGTTPPPQKITGPVVVWERDIAGEVKKKYAESWLEIKGFKVSLKLNEDILDVLEAEKAHAVAQFMVQDAQVLCENAVNHIVAVLKNFDPRKSQHRSEKGTQVAVQSAGDEIKETVQKLAEDVGNVPKARWKKFVDQHHQYQLYKVQVAGNVVLGTLGLVASGVAVAAAVPTGGASLALGIVTAVRSTAALIRTCADLWKDAKDIQESLKSDIKVLGDAYLEAPKGAVGAREIAGTVLKSALGTFPPFMKSLSKCNSDYKLWDDKVSHLVVNHGEISKEAMEVFTHVQELEKTMAKAQTDAAHKILEHVKKLRVMVHTGLEKTSNLGGQISEAEKNMPTIKEALDQLNGSNPKYAEIFDKVLPAAVNLALAGAGAGMGFKEATNALEYYQTAQGLANDILNEIKEQVQG